MMMFQFHIAYSLELLILGAGLVLIYAGLQRTSRLLTIGGYVLTIATILNLLCTSYYGVRYWEEGYFTPRAPQMMMQSGMANGKMMQGGMMNGGMMMGGQQGGMMPAGKSITTKPMNTAPAAPMSTANPSDPEHDSHHPEQAQ